MSYALLKVLEAELIVKTLFQLLRMKDNRCTTVLLLVMIQNITYVILINLNALRFFKKKDL